MSTCWNTKWRRKRPIRETGEEFNHSASSQVASPLHFTASGAGENQRGVGVEGGAHILFSRSPGSPYSIFPAPGEPVSYFSGPAEPVFYFSGPRGARILFFRSPGSPYHPLEWKVATQEASKKNKRGIDSSCLLAGRLQPLALDSLRAW